LVTIAVELFLVGTLLSQPLRDLAGVALLGLLLYERIRGVEPQRIPTRWVIAIVAFLVVNVISAWTSADPQQAFADLRFYPLGVLVFLGVERVTRDDWRGVAAVVLGLVVVFAADTILQYWLGRSWLRPQIPMWGRFQGALQYPSDISLLPLLLPIGAAALADGGRTRIVAAASAVTLVAAAVSLSGTRIALAALVVTAATAGSLQRRARLGLALLAIAAVVAVGTAGLAKATAPKRLLAAETYRSERRPSQWRAAIMLFRERPLLGQGPHSFKRILSERRNDPVLRRVDRRYAPYPHDVYLEALAGTGILGFVALAGLLGLGLRTLYRQRTTSAIARAALASLASFAAVAIFDLSLSRDWVQLAFWLPLGIACAVSSDGASAARESTGRPHPR
jgi:putative inorganic carbon (hco3(-)) transporter